jgi:predicted house-cleaning noncanonical NTP pyrophosphatase (MazG superfamily)
MSVSEANQANDSDESSTPPPGPPPLVRSQVALATGEHVRQDATRWLDVEDMKEIIHDQLQEELYESLYTNLFNELSSLLEGSRRDLEARVRHLEQALGQVARTPLASDRTR